MSLLFNKAHRLAMSVLILASTYANAQVITTVAGGLGNGGMATSVAQLKVTTCVVADGRGNVYVSDSSASCIRKITPSGAQTIYAGTGVTGYGGDGGPATAARLQCISDMALDTAGNLYFADRCSFRIRKISPTGIITTIAGSGTLGYTGDGGAATLATINPAGIATDQTGNVYIAQTSNHCIRMIVSATGMISSIAGTGTAGYSGDAGTAVSATLNGPTDVAVDTMGNVYIADAGNYRIRRIDRAGTIHHFAGNGTSGYSGDGGLATAAAIGDMNRIAVKEGGELLIASYWQYVVRSINLSGIISTIAGTGTGLYSGDFVLATAANMTPYSIATDTRGNIFVADARNNRVRQVNTRDTVSTIAGPGNYGGDGGPATTATLYYPSATALDLAGNIYIADMYNNAIRKIDRSGIITTIAGAGTAGYGGDGGPATAALLNNPIAVAADPAGNVYVSDFGNNRLRKISSSGTISTIAGDGSAGYGGDGGPATAARLNKPNGLRADAAGNIYFADMANNCVRQISPTGIINTIVGTGSAGYGGDGGPSTVARLNRPTGVALDAIGNLYVSEGNNHCIRMVNTSSVITTIAGNGTAGYGGDGGPATAASMSAPAGVTIDNQGNMLIADEQNNRIRLVTPAGVIATIAGIGSVDYGGDGGPATAASLSALRVATDTAGYLYIADAHNNRIRKVFYRTFLGLPSFVGAEAVSLTAQPNPAKSSITMHLPGNWSKGVIVIFNGLGQLSVQEDFNNDNNGNIVVDVSHLMPGGYTVRLTTNGRTYYAKVIVEQ